MESNLLIICGETAMEMIGAKRRYEIVLEKHPELLNPPIFICHEKIKLSDDMEARDILLTRTLYYKELESFPDNIFNIILMAKNIIDEKNLIITDTVNYIEFSSGKVAIGRIEELLKNGFYCNSVKQLKNFFFEKMQLVTEQQ